MKLITVYKVGACAVKVRNISIHNLGSCKHFPQPPRDSERMDIEVVNVTERGSKG